METLAQKMNAIASESPEFRETLVRYKNLQSHYDEARAKELETNFFSRLFKRKD